MVRRMDPNGEALVWCRKCSGYARCRLLPEADEPLWARIERHQRAWTDVENFSSLKQERFRTGMLKDGKWMETREESQGRSARG